MFDFLFDTKSEKTKCFNCNGEGKIYWSKKDPDVSYVDNRERQHRIRWNKSMDERAAKGLPMVQTCEYCGGTGYTKDKN